MRHRFLIVPLCLCCFCCFGCREVPAAEIRVRPATWAVPVIGGDLDNWHKLTDEVYRCEQPDDDEFKELQEFGIRSVLNLREYHSDDDEAEGLGLMLYHLRWDTKKVTVDQLVEALRIVKAAPKPMIVHCWHGSDRTGTVCAAYRIVFQGWEVEAAVDEMIHGDYGFHSTFDNLPALLRGADWDAVKKRVEAE